MKTFGLHSRLSYRAGRWQAGTRALPEEVPVALTYNGTTQAVMMATPADLEDFAVGFSFTEQVIADLSEIREIEVIELSRGIELRIWLQPEAGERFLERRRAQVGPVGCGLCGIDSLDEALRQIPRVTASLQLAAGDVRAAMDALVRHQVLNDATRAVHAAGFYLPGAGVTLAREDVGRHNALDKLAGALVRAGQPAAHGALVITSRVSVDMVQKAAVIGAPVLTAASAPTALAAREAEAAGITLVAVVRGADFEVFTHGERFSEGLTKNVA